MIVIDGIVFNNIIMSASGCWVKNISQINELATSKLSGIVLKTTSLYEQKEHVEPNYMKTDTFHINCKGIPCCGYTYYRNIINDNASSKQYIMSLVCNNIEHLKFMLNDLEKLSKLILVELNISCPNKDDRICGYHANDIMQLCNIICCMNLKYIKIGLKMPPYFEKEKIFNIATVINAYDCIKYIVCSNSIPLGCILENSQPVLGNIYGGISGSAINKCISISNVRLFKQYLNENIIIIGCGGISTVEDINDYIIAGAQMVQLEVVFIII